jgi:hypothetical protein
VSLNKLFTGNIVDKNGTPVSNILIKGYDVTTGIWSTVYDTDFESQYNVNLGDGGFKTQDGTSKAGDTVLLRFETKHIDPLDRQFASYKVNLSNADVYVQDVQLMDCQPVIAENKWTIRSSIDGNNTFQYDGKIINIGRINDLITTSTNFNDDYTWTYDGALMEHRSVDFGQDIFGDRLGVVDIAYDWTDDDTFISSGNYTYTNISHTLKKYTDVEVKVTNKKGQVTTNIRHIQIRYNSPIPDVTWSPDQPSANGTFIISGNTEDIDERVINVKYIYDDKLVIDSPLVKYQWVQTTGSVYSDVHTIKLEVTWNDGFNNITIPYIAEILMSNLPPEFTLENIAIGDELSNDMRYNILNLTDPDGDDDLIELKWRIEFKTPFDNVYKTVYNPGYPTIPNLDSKEWIFNVSGDYRITATAKDSFGAETSRSVVNTFTYSAACAGYGKIKLNSDTWQMISIPIENKTVEEYFLKKVDDAIKLYGINYKTSDVIDVCVAYPGHLDKHLSYVPGFTDTNSEHNFKHVISDGSNINEITGFWIKVKDYKTMTHNADLIIEWDQQD